MKRALSRGFLILALGVMVLSGLLHDARPGQAQTYPWEVDVFFTPNLGLTPDYETDTTALLDYTWPTAPVINGATVPGAPDDGYSVRFTRNVSFTAGLYTFTLIGDEGVNLYVDGVHYINRWDNAAPATFTADVQLSAGFHVIVVEMEDTGGEGRVALTWTVVPPTAMPPTLTPTSGPVYVPSTNAWNAEFFNNPDLSGAPVFIGVYPPSGLNLNWGLGSPNPAVPVDNFSARFTRTINIPAEMPAGTYRFYARADDAFRFYINNNAGTDYLLFDFWGYKRNETFTADYPLGPGSHTFRFEFQELTADAYVFLTWSPPNAQNPILNPDGGTGDTNNPNEGFGLAACPYGSVPGSPTVPAGWPPVAGPSAICNDGWNSYSNNPNGTCSWHGGVRAWCIGSPPSGATPLPGVATLVPGQPTLTPVPPAAAGTVNVNILNFRAGPSLQAEIIGKLNRGFTYPIQGRTPDSTWLYISVGGRLGWVMGQYLAIEGDLNAVPVIPYESAGIAPTPTPTPLPQIQLPDVNVRGRTLANLVIRSDPNRRAERLGVIPWNTEVQIFGRDNGHAWYLLNYNGIVGWSYAPLIRLTLGAFDDLPYLDGSVPVFAPPPTEGIIAQAFGNMRIRSGPGLNFPQISKAQWGTRVEVLGRSPDRQWLKIRHGDVVGWSAAAWYRIMQGSLADVPTVTE